MKSAKIGGSPSDCFMVCLITVTAGLSVHEEDVHDGMPQVKVAVINTLLGKQMTNFEFYVLFKSTGHVRTGCW